VPGWPGFRSLDLWLVSSYVISAYIDERFTNFGASGCVVYALLTGVLLEVMFRRTVARSHPPTQG